MHIDDDHLYHGAALIQIAEDPRFTAINSLKIGSKTISVAYKINDEIAVYLKYASKPTPAHKEYTFVFKEGQLNELATIAKHNHQTFVALVCVADREICCISYKTLTALVAQRKIASGGKSEEQYVVLVTAQKGKSLRMYMNQPNKKNTIMGKQILVSRKDFPEALFVRS